MAQQFFRISQLASKPGRPGLLPVSTATLWRWVAAGTFPQPIKLSAGVTAWNAQEVADWSTAQTAARAVEVSK
jgi:predicted DNA-binding transcriptional regulator AlpA